MKELPPTSQCANFGSQEDHFDAKVTKEMQRFQWFLPPDLLPIDYDEWPSK
jgi:hypothetical protein